MGQFESMLVVIPARGGSKGIPKKNLQLLNDDPLFTHSINHALEVGIPHSHILVSSDDEEILSIADSYGVVAHQRPDSISGDNSSTEECLIDAWESHQDCDTVVRLQPTSPIRISLKRFLDHYVEGKFDSGLTVTKFENFFWKRNSGNWTPVYNLEHRMMRQKLRESQFRYFDCGNVYITNAEILNNTKCRLGGKIDVFPITHVEGMQIDDPDDLEAFRKMGIGWNFSRRNNDDTL